ADDGGAHDGDAAHRGRAGLHGVPLGHVLVDGLPHPPLDEPADEEARAHEGGDHRQRRGEEERYHPAPSRRRRSAALATSRSSKGRCSSPTTCTASWPFPAITTTSPARADEIAWSMAVA